MSEGITLTLPDILAERVMAKAVAVQPISRVSGPMMGGYRSLFKLRGMEFDEVRLYQAGDDVRAIDWHVTGRMGKPYTKLFYEERQRTVLTLLDLRPSMQFGTQGVFKSVAAAQLAAQMMWAVHDGKDRVGGVILSPTEMVTVPPKNGDTHLMHLMKKICEGTHRVSDGTSLAFTKGLETLGRLSPQGSSVVIISDFADFNQDAQKTIKGLALHHDLLLVLIYDNLEKAAPPLGTYVVADGQGNQATFQVESQKWQRAYAKIFAARVQQVESLAHQVGAQFLSVGTHEKIADIMKGRLWHKGHPSLGHQGRREHV